MANANMTAGVFLGEGVLEVQQRRVPSLPAPDWVLIENEGCGVCGSDLHILSVPAGIPATPNTVLGHEFIGKILEIGLAVTTVKVGDRVAVAPNLTCGLCKQCKMGQSVHCENWKTLGVNIDGGFARYTTAPERALHPISKDLPFEEAAWIEPLSCVVNGTDQLAIQPGQVAVVMGAGPVGTLHAMMFKAAGATVFLSDVVPFRLTTAKKAGIDNVINVKTESLRDAVMDASDGLGADVVVDAVGNQFGAMIGLAARRGKLSVFGMNEHAHPEVKQHDITRHELKVFGSFVGAHTFPRAIKILERGVIKPSALVSMTLPVEEIETGINAARAGEAVKVLVTPTN
jgi:threonine dehydrogenase-like Zn-dependent dehydrogenase